MILVLPNVTMEEIKCEGKKKDSLNVTRVQSHVMLELYNVRMNRQM